ncbi:Ger(x)C family spore germination protein [Bacillus suaedae]|uniref:Ger(X)C family spore germination protein n=1 Tax=Halalkalibacter suaedae TaxID=2822140 RepID=A0A940WY79_9BACI|nr:Ger(x)C family spore germination protein [Bacillus suaedae]MBP3952942.1 Ger(x)C family spore germination protein [Bacillus suaedae]
MKRLLSQLLLLSLILQLVGCWDRREINDLAIVTASGFDIQGEDEYLITAQAPIPGAMGGTGGGGGGTSGGAMFYLDAGIGKSVRQANQDLQKRMARRLMFGHRRVVVFGEDLAKVGLRETLDVLTRTREARLNTQLFIAKGKANEVLAALPQLENLSSEAIREQGVNTYYLTLEDFLTDYQRTGDDPLLPVLQTVKNKAPNPELQEDQIEISQFAVFKEDKIAFMTDEKQTVAATFLIEKMKGKTYSVEWESGVVTDLLIKQQSKKMSYTIKDNMPVFQITVNLKGNVLEDQKGLNFEEREAMEQLNKQINKQVETEMNNLLDETLSKGIDTFGFGWLLHRRDREKWANEWKDSWRTLLPTLTYEVKVNSSIEFTGLVTEGIGIGE